MNTISDVVIPQAVEDNTSFTWPLSLTLLFGVIACVGTVGNILIIWAVCVEHQLRTLGNAFIVNLAVADLIVTAYTMPFGIISSQFQSRPFNNVFCDFNAFVLTQTCSISTQSLMLIAIERYIYVCHPFRYPTLFTRKTVYLYLVAAWIFTIFGSVQGWTGWTSYHYGKEYFLCIFYGPQSLSYDLCLTIFGFVIPFSTLTFCYVSIYRLVKNSKDVINNYGQSSKPNETLDTPQNKRRAKEYRFIIMLVTIVIVFSVMWAPGAVVMALSGSLGHGGIPVSIYSVSIWFALYNSATNSILYGIMNTNFRRGYKNVLQQVIGCAFTQSTNTIDIEMQNM